jgi:hypothetical protein
VVVFITNKISATMRKIALAIASLFATISFSYAQQKYCNYENASANTFGYRDGKLDSLAANPKVSTVNNNQKVLKYVRSSSKFDNLKIHPAGVLEDVSGFSTFHKDAQQLKMKVYSSAPAGTLIEIQFTKKGIDGYPKGVQSQYQAKTTKKNEWEEITFTFVNAPEGSEVGVKDIDEIVILFAPNSSSTETFYFSDLTGPKFIEASAAEPVKTSNKE